MDIKSAKAELSAIQLKLAGIVDTAKASNRDLTHAEADTIEQDAARALQLKAMIAGAERGEKLDDFVKSAGTFSGGALTDADAGLRPSLDTPKGFITPAAVRRMAKSQAKTVETKGLVAGGADVTPVDFDPTPRALATPMANLSILDVIAVKKRDSGSYGYVRQTVRTNNADVVPAGTLKPTSVFTVEPVEAKLEVIAHMSEYVDIFLLKDNTSLENFLSAELVSGIFSRLARKAVDEFSAVAGSQTQAFVNNAMDSIYLASSKAQSLGYNPDVVLLSRATFDEIALEKDDAGNYLYRKAEDSRLNGLYPVIVDGIDADTAVVLDSSQVGFSTDREGITTRWDSATRFDYNEVRALTEGRFGVDVYAAPSIVIVETSAAA